MNTTRKVLIASTSEDLLGLRGAAAASQADIEFEFAPQQALRTLNGKSLELAALVLDIDAGRPGALHEFEALTGSMQNQKVIAAARNADSGDVRRLFRAGAADVLTAPFDSETLLSTLMDVLAPVPAAAGAGKGKLVSVVKTAGGAGATTVALNLARLLRGGEGRQPGPRRSTAVLDLDLQFGDTDVGLNLQPRSTILDIIRAQSRFDGRFLQNVLTEHESGLRLLAPSPDVMPLDAISPAFAESLVREAARTHDVTVVDLPGSWADWTLPVLRASDLIILVAPATVAGAVGARRVLDALRGGQVTTPLFFLVSKVAGLFEAMEKPGRIGRTLDLPVDGALAFDAQATKAADRGRLVVEVFPTARLSKDLRAMASKVQQKLTVAASQPASPGVAA